MANYFDNLTPTQKENIAILTKTMKDRGITNPITQAGILAIVSKESNFLPRNETSYSKTSNDRIRQIFGSRVAGYTNAQLDSLKKNDVAFYDAVYGMNTKVGRDGGNNQAGDGYKYRGRGFNGITFKGAYKKYGDMIGVDLVSNPDKLNEVPNAAAVLIEYFKRSIANAPKDKLTMYNATNINDFKTVQDSVGAIYHANAGWGKSKASIDADPTGGKAKADARVGGFYEILKSRAIGTVEIVKKNPLTTILITAALAFGGYILINKLKN